MKREPTFRPRIMFHRGPATRRSRTGNTATARRSVSRRSAASNPGSVSRGTSVSRRSWVPGTGKPGADVVATAPGRGCGRPGCTDGDGAAGPRITAEAAVVMMNTGCGGAGGRQSAKPWSRSRPAPQVAVIPNSNRTAPPGTGVTPPHYALSPRNGPMERAPRRNESDRQSFLEFETVPGRRGDRRVGAKPIAPDARMVNRSLEPLVAVRPLTTVAFDVSTSQAP